MSVELELKPSHKLELLSAVFQGRPLRSILEPFTTRQLVQAHAFLWDKLVEIHYLTQPRQFEREVVTRNMVPSATYQRQQGCDLRLDYCKGVECIWSNPVCAGNKVKNNMEAMAKAISQYLKSSKQARPVPLKKRYVTSIEVNE
ncbi:MAG: hypothetical protein ACE5IY_02100 [bacterium]